MFDFISKWFKAFGKKKRNIKNIYSIEAMKKDIPMKSIRPYLLLAYRDWMIDNSLTPQLLIHTDYPGVLVPTTYIQNDTIILNVDPEAIADFDIDIAANTVSFNASFHGRLMHIFLPIRSIYAIFAEENEVGMCFEQLDGLEYLDDDESEDDHPGQGSQKGPTRSHLTVIK